MNKLTVMSLNCWGGRVYQPLMDLICLLRGTVDVFCFQEVFSTETGNTQYGDYRIDLFQGLEYSLPDYVSYFSAQKRGAVFGEKVDFQLSFGVATFVRKPLAVLNFASQYVFRSEKELNIDVFPTPRVLHSVTVDVGGTAVQIAHFHGLWNGGGKGDCSERMEQSLRVVETLKQGSENIILVGDFNYDPDTQCLAVLEDGLINLIKVHGIKSTRSGYYEKSQKFADYMLHSPGLSATSFKVLPDEVSDHLALLGEFSLSF